MKTGFISFHSSENGYVSMTAAWMKEKEMVRIGQNGQKWTDSVFPKIQNESVPEDYGTKAYFPKLSWPTWDLVVLSLL